MYVEIGSKFDLIINSIQDIDTCYGLIDSVIDMCETDDYLVFAIYKFNVMFFNYLDSINNVFLNEKYKNDELYGLAGINPSEKKSLLFSITLQLFELFKENDTISSSNYYLLLCYFVGKKNIIVGVDPIVSENNKDADIFNSVSVDDEVNINQSDISNENNQNVYSDDSLDNLTDDNNIEESVNGLENQQVVTFDENSQDEINNSVSTVYDIISVEDDSIIEDKDFNSVVQSYISNENNQDVNNGVSLDKSVTVDDEDIARKRLSKFLKYVILYLLFFIVALVLIIILLNSYDDVSKLGLDYNNLLEGVSVDEKISYIESLEREISEKTASFGNYDEEIKTISDKISSISSDNEALSNELSSKQSELSKKKNTYDELNNKFVKMSLKIIPNVITFNQYPNYPNGCEAVALYILLKYYNVNVSVGRVMDSLPIGKTPYLVDGVLYGGDPNYEFLGDPRSDDGWGIYDQGLSYVANKFKPNIINGTGMDFSKIYGLIDSGRPVIVLTSVNLKDPYEHKSWISDKTGNTITWKRFNHAVVVIGYNDDFIVVSDPIDGKIKYFNKDRFIYCYNFMGRRALYY